MGIGGIGGTCGPARGNTGMELARKMDAQHLSQDYDSMQGFRHTLYFFPLSNRLYVNTPLYFRKDDRIQGYGLTGMELVDGSQLASYGGVDMPASFANAWLVLKDNCGDTLCELPLSRINRVLNGGKNLFFNKLPVEWNQSYIRLTNVGALGNAGFLFHIWTV